LLSVAQWLYQHLNNAINDESFCSVTPWFHVQLLHAIILAPDDHRALDSIILILYRILFVCLIYCLHLSCIS